MDVVAATAADETLLLDLLNTTPVVDGLPTDGLADFEQARPWMTVHGIPARTSEYTGLLEARAVLQAIVRGDRPPSAVQPVLGGAQLIPVATAHGIDWRMTENTGAVRAALAWDSLRITSPGRLRPCANTECRLFLIDRSKPNTARWCSMSACGNRMKARRHYNKNAKPGS